MKELNPTNSLFLWGQRALILTFLLSKISGGSEPRISSIFFDKSQVGHIYIKPSLSTVVQFPCDIEEAKVGLKSSLEVEVSKTLKRELILSARSNLASPTNLIVRCSHGNFVFDVIPNSDLHQDFIRILGAVRGPKFQNTLSEVPQEPKPSLSRLLKQRAKPILDEITNQSANRASLSKRIRSKRLLKSSLKPQEKPHQTPQKMKENAQ